jgi:hypothetical protein
MEKSLFSREGSCGDYLKTKKAPPEGAFVVF